MPFDISDPFRKHPARLARLPRVVRLYILNSVFGFALAAVFTGLVLHLNVADVGRLVASVDGGWLAAAIFFFLNGIVFASVQTAIVVMTAVANPRPPLGPNAPQPVALRAVDGVVRRP